MSHRRHDLLRIRPDRWQEILAAAPDVDNLSGERRRVVEDWADRGFPVIVRREVGAAEPGIVGVGLPLPPSLGKLRIGLVLREEMIAEAVPAVPLASALDSAPDAWHGEIEAVLALGHAHHLQPAVFGALLWQHLTGLPYLHEGSDLDLLWPVDPRTSLDAFLNELAALDQAGPVRIDGELILADGVGVNWRELHRERARPNGTVLVKSMGGAELTCARSLFG